jgi:hypothetical protein
MDKNTLLYLTLSNYGSKISLKIKFNDKTEKFINWTENNFKYVRYNPRKPIERYGLSITSLDGSLSGIPDLDSLTQYNYDQGNFNHTGNFIKEKDIKIPTPVYNYPAMKELCDPWVPYLFRTHILKINPGGYFPPHRDHTNINLESFRLLMAMKNCHHPHFTFIINNKLVEWEQGKLYFVDTTKEHYLFNCGTEPAYMLVINVDVNKNTIQKVIDNFDIR